MARFNPYTLILTYPELLQPSNKLSAIAMANLFSLDYPDSPTPKFYRRITYRIRKLNQLLLSRGLRFVTHGTIPPTYSVTNLVEGHPYYKSQSTLARTSSIRNSILASGVSNYPITKPLVTEKEYKLIKNMYRAPK